MKLKELIKVLDIDSKIIICESGYDWFDGFVYEIETKDIKPETFDKEVKAVWYSVVLNRIMIEI